MANTYTWDIPAVDCRPTEGDLSTVVYNVHWRYNGVDSSDNTGTIIGTQTVGAPDPDDFTPFADLTKKIVKDVCEIYRGNKKYLYLGDIKPKIDWGYAKDYVEIAWKIMQKKKPDFFIIGTGVNTSVEKFAQECFEYVGLNYKKYLKINKKLLRPSKTVSLVGDTSKARKKFKFKIETSLEKIISIMMENDLKIEMNKK